MIIIIKYNNINNNNNNSAKRERLTPSRRPAASAPPARPAAPAPAPAAPPPPACRTTSGQTTYWSNYHSGYIAILHTGQITAVIISPYWSKEYYCSSRRAADITTAPGQTIFWPNNVVQTIYRSNNILVKRHAVQVAAPWPDNDTETKRRRRPQALWSNDILVKRHSGQTTFWSNDVLVKRCTGHTTYWSNDIMVERQRPQAPPSSGTTRDSDTSPISRIGPRHLRADPDISERTPTSPSGSRHLGSDPDISDPSLHALLQLFFSCAGRSDSPTHRHSHPGPSPDQAACTSRAK